MTGSTIYVIGDSHTRSFSFNRNFTPLFLGQGKEINFTSVESYNKVVNSVLHVLQYFSDNDSIILFLGEPDTRYYLSSGWYPWDNENLIDIKGHQEKVALSINRYSDFIKLIKSKFSGNIYVLNVIPSNRKEQNIVVDEYNKQLSKACNDISVEFLHANEFIYSDENHTGIKPEYFSDQVHLNHRLQIVVQELLTSFGVNIKDDFNSKISWDNKEVQSKFYYDEKFGCYKMKKEIGNWTLSDISLDRSTVDDNLIGSKLKEFGVVVINNYTEAEVLRRISNEFQQILSADSSGCIEVRPYSLGKAALVTRNDDFKDRFPASYEFFDDTFMQRITELYMGKGYIANEKIFVVKDIVGSKHHANDLHFDVQKTLKFFLYIKDTTEANGAFRCVPGTHKITEDIRKKNAGKISYDNREFSRMLPYGTESTISVDGKAGSLIIFDTDVFHQTGTVTSYERWAMRGQTRPQDGTESVAITKKTAKPGLLERIKNKLLK